jgi:dienelactone hydrolase
VGLRGLVAACLVTMLGYVAASHAQPATIPLPADVKAERSAADVPAGVARFAGAWGPGAWDGVLPHVLVVATVDAGGRAQVVYAVGDSAEMGVTRASRRVTARIVGDLLTVDLAEHVTLTYGYAGDVLRGTYTSRRGRSTVTLPRAKLADVIAVPAGVPGAVTGTTVRIPLGEPGRGGTPATLEATLYRPPGDGPHPVAIFHHGSTGGGNVPLSVTLRPSRQAAFFVGQGLAVLAPMRRGRGASDGVYAEREGPCEAHTLSAGVMRAIEDADAALAYLRAQPWADPARVLVAGQSRGGLLAVAYAAERPGAARGVINFAGGWTSQRCDDAGRGFNQAAFAAAGGRTRIPMLWLYAEEDSYYSAAWIRRYHEAFAQAGGVATLRLFPGFGLRRAPPRGPARGLEGRRRGLPAAARPDVERARRATPRAASGPAGRGASRRCG